MRYKEKQVRVKGHAYNKLIKMGREQGVSVRYVVCKMLGLFTVDGGYYREAKESDARYRFLSVREDVYERIVEGAYNDKKGVGEYMEDVIMKEWYEFGKM